MKYLRVEHCPQNQIVNVNLLNSTFVYQPYFTVNSSKQRSYVPKGDRVLGKNRNQISKSQEQLFVTYTCLASNDLGMYHTYNIIAYEATGDCVYTIVFI